MSYEWRTSWRSTSNLPRFSLLSDNADYYDTSVNVNSFALVESLAFPTQISTELTNSEHLYAQIFLTEAHSNEVIKVKSTDRNPFTPLNKIRLSLLLFSRHSQILKFLLTSLLPNFIKVWQKR